MPKPQSLKDYGFVTERIVDGVLTKFYRHKDKPQDEVAYTGKKSEKTDYKIKEEVALVAEAKQSGKKVSELKAEKVAAKEGKGAVVKHGN